MEERRERKMKRGIGREKQSERDRERVNRER